MDVGEGGRGKGVDPGGGRVVRGRDVRRRVVEREAWGAPKAGGSSSGRWLSECRWKHQAPGKRPSGRFHFFLEEKINK